MSCTVKRKDGNGEIMEVLANNGKPSHLFNTLSEVYSNKEEALRAYAKTMTPAFKQWFGDSKVVDVNGEPLIVYHGTNTAFDEFNSEFSVVGLYGKGFYFTENKDSAQQWANENLMKEETYVLPVYLNIKNPQRGELQYIIPNQFDGAVVEDEMFWVAKEPNQVRTLLSQDQLSRKTNSVMEDALFAPGYSSAMDNFFEAVAKQEAEQTPIGKMDNLINLKDYLLKLAFEKLTQLEGNIKNNREDAELSQKLLKEKNELTEYIYGNEENEKIGLIQEIANLKAETEKNAETIAPYIEKEFQRLDNLVNSDNPADLQEAEDIINFIKEMDNFSLSTLSKKEHPIFNEKDVTDGKGKLTITDNFRAPFTDWTTRANHYSELLSNKTEIVVKDTINNTDQVRKMFGNNAFDIADLNKPIKDAHWFDMFFMDIAAGVWSTNGIIPQVIKARLSAEFEKEKAWSTEIAEEIDHILPELKKELRKLGHGISFLGLKEGVDYNLFFREDGDMVYKYSSDWFDDSRQMINRYDELKKIASKIQIDEARKEAYRNAYNFRNNWFKNHSFMLNPAMLPEVTSDPSFEEFDSYFEADNSKVNQHVSELKKLVGEKHYKVVVEAQKQRLREYKAQYSNKVKDLLLDQGITEIADMDEYHKATLQIWQETNNPFRVAEYAAAGKPFFVGNRVVHPNYEFSEHVPLDKVDGKDSGYYDSKYKTIEGNDTLSKFYDIAFKTTSGIRSRLSADAQKYTHSTSLPAMARNFTDLIANKDLHFFQKISESFRQMLDGLKSLISVRMQDSFSSVDTDILTGERKSGKVNDSFLRGGYEKVKQIFQVEGIRFSQNFQNYRDPNATPIEVTRYTEIKIDPTDINKAGRIASILTSYLPNAMNMSEIVSKYGRIIKDTSTNKDFYVIPVGKLIYREAQKQVAQKKSLDLPKILKMYANAAAQYSARQEVLPLMEVTKRYYEEIKKVETSNIGKTLIHKLTGKTVVSKTGKRDKAIQQINDWYQRVVLGNTGLRKQHGVTDVKFYTTEEKQLLSKVKESLAKETNTDSDNYKQLKSIEDNLGANLAASGVFDSFLRFLRLKGLGWNMSSGVTNLIQGQIANHQAAASGIWFPSDNIYTVTAMDMIAADSLSKFSPALVTKKVAIAKTAMKHFDLLKDQSNELQKASNKSAFASMRRFNPYYQTKKGEEYNQTPVAAAIMKDTIITGKNNSKSNLFDALTATWDSKAKAWILGLKDEFNTEENQEAWLKKKAQDFYTFKARVDTTIADIHGDFNPDSGMMAKSTHTGQALTMFKTWLPREIYKAWGISQSNILTGIQDFKGRMRSHTSTTGFLQGAVYGATFAGPWGLLAGGVIAGTASLIYGAKPGVGVMQHLIITGEILAKKIISLPINPIARVITGKNAINAFKAADRLGMSDIDKANFRANMQQLINTIIMFAMFFAAKAFFWDDDDEDDSTRRKTHNLLVNRLMNLISEATIFLNPTELWSNNTGDHVALLKFFADVKKEWAAINGYLEGHDTIASGINSGQSKLANTTSKLLLPGIFQNLTLPTMGATNKETMKNVSGAVMESNFGTLMSRQFVPSPWDRYFWGQEKLSKNEIKMMKAERKAQLLELGVEEDIIKATLKQEFPRKRKGQTYEDQLETIEDLSDDD